jgi:hypothetical protein
MDLQIAARGSGCSLPQYAKEIFYYLELCNSAGKS